MKNIPWRAVAVALPILVFAAVCAAILSGCNASGRHGVLIPPPSATDVARTVTGHRERERVQFQAVERINVVVAGLPVEPEVRGQTSIIVEANKAASAQQIEDILAAFARATLAFDARHAADQKDIADLRAEVHALKDAAARETVAKLRWFGFGCFGFALAAGYVGFIAFPPARTLAFGLVGLGVLALAFAQLWAYVSAQWWFMPLTGAVALGILGAVAVVIWHSVRHHTLAKDAAAAAEQTSGTLKVLVSTIEQAKKTIGKASPISALLDLLKDNTDKAHRDLIDQVALATKPTA